VTAAAGGGAQIICGDSAEVLKTLEAGSVQTCVTSPPYYGLRDYGVSGQIGLEETPEAYVAKLVQVFHEVRRVLANDGTLWLNLGDSYAGSWGAMSHDLDGKAKRTGSNQRPPTANKMDGIKPKDLIGIPWMVAFALRADGWYLRSDIIWHKPNPMPESVTDRPTKSHEYIFLLSKSAQYYYDYEAIKEPATYPGDDRKARAKEEHKYTAGEKINGIRPRKQDGTGNRQYTGFNDLYEPLDFRNRRDVWTVTTKPYVEAHFATFPPDLIEPCILAGSREGDTVLDPFNGSGTTGAVSIKHHRNYIGIELNPAYVELTDKRLSSVQPVLFAQVTP
jgi:DNA modification methylase